MAVVRAAVSRVASVSHQRNNSATFATIRCCSATGGNGMRADLDKFASTVGAKSCRTHVQNDFQAPSERHRRNMPLRRSLRFEWVWLLQRCRAHGATHSCSQDLVEGGVEEVGGGGARGGEPGFQRVAPARQLVHFRHDPLLFGRRWE